MTTDTRLRIIIDALDKSKAGVTAASKNMSSLQKKVNDMKPAFTKLAVAGAAAFAGIALGVKKAVKEIGDFESIKVSFDAMVKDVGVSGDELISKLNEAAAGTINSTDLMLSANKAMALGVAKDMGEFTQLMEIARLKGRALGLDTTQAFNDIVTGIGRGSPLILDNLGITIKLGEAQRQYAESLNKTTAELTDNEKKEALKFAVLKAGNEELERAGELTLTYNERKQQLKKSVNDATLALGKAFLPAIESITKKLIPLVEKLAKWIEKNPKLTKGLIIAVGVLTGLAAVFGVLAVVVPIVAAAFTILTAPITLIILAIVALVAGIVLLIKNFDQVKAFFVKIWTSIADFAQGVFQRIGDAFRNTFQAIGDFFRNIFQGIKDFFVGVFDFILGFFITIMDMLFPQWREYLTLMFEVWSNIWQGIKDFFVNIWESISTFLTEKFTAISNFFKAMNAGMKASFEVIWGAIKGVVMSVVEAIKTAVQNAMQSIRNFVEPIITLVERLINKIKEVGGSVGKAFGKIRDKVGNFFQGVQATGTEARQNGVINVNDAIVTPDGKVIKTHPNDFLMAMKKPSDLFNLNRGGGGSPIMVTITNNSFMGEEDMAEKVGDKIADILKRGQRF